MCVFCYQPKDKVLPKEHIIEAVRSNRDGWGLAAITGSKEFGPIEIHRGWSSDDAVKACSFYAGFEMVFHARIGTSGERNLENTHPFSVIENELYVFHNGVFTKLSDYHSQFSDTWHLAAQLRPFFKEFGMSLLDKDFFLNFMETLCGYGNKLALVSTEKVVLINESRGIWRNGIWYSNSTAFPGIVGYWSCGAADYQERWENWMTRNGSHDEKKAITGSTAAAPTPVRRVPRGAIQDVPQDEDVEDGEFNIAAEELGEQMALPPAITEQLNTNPYFGNEEGVVGE